MHYKSEHQEIPPPSAVIAAFIRRLSRIARTRSAAEKTQ